MLSQCSEACWEIFHGFSLSADFFQNLQNVISGIPSDGSR